jgi:RNA polymerase primary sigma factor
METQHKDQAGWERLPGVKMDNKKSDHIRDTTMELLAEYATASESNRLLIREQVIELNMGLIKCMALRYCHNQDIFDDLMQAGKLGLLEAMENFDVNRGVVFGTYAGFYIKKAIINADNSDSDKSVNYLEAYNRINRNIKQFENEHHRQPTDSELHDIFHVGYDVINNVRDKSNAVRVEFSDEMIDINDDYSNVELNMTIDSALKLLKELDRKIIINMFGLFDHGKMTLEHLGSLLDRAPANVWVRRDRALNRLKKYHAAYKIFDGYV